MLSTDLVRTRKKEKTLKVIKLDRKMKERALEMAAHYIEITKNSIGLSREEYLDLTKYIGKTPTESKIANGLKKLIIDRCEFSTHTNLDPREIRKEIFSAAQKMRQLAAKAQEFNRATLLQEIAHKHQLNVEELNEALYADLKGAQRLLKFDALNPAQLIETYNDAQEQAVLLKATQVRVKLICRSAHNLRYLFNKLKFHRLLFELIPLNDPGHYQLSIEGPASLFRLSTRYGLALALVLPALKICESFELEADLIWGKSRRRLNFVLEHKLKRSEQKEVTQDQHLSEEASALFERFKNKSSDWQVSAAQKIIHIPGSGLTIPDLVFKRADQSIYLEIMGYWSRKSVFDRIKLAESGLAEKIIFACSDRLRVSEKALGSKHPAALVVFKGTIHASQIENALNALNAKKPRSK